MRTGLLAAAVFFLMSNQSEATGIIAKAVENYSGVNSYSVTLESRADGETEIIRYYYKRPGFVRMEFVRPHEGAVLVYDPGSDKVRLRPFGFLSSLVLTLSPQSWVIRSAGGHTVDESDIGSLLKNVKELAEGGTVEVRGKDELEGRSTVKVEVKGEGARAEDSVYRYLLWLDSETLMPLKVHAWKGRGEEDDEEVVEMTDLELNPGIPEDFFDLE